MCIALVKEPKKSVGMIIYNFIFSNEKYNDNFTVAQIASGVRKLGLDITDADVQNEIDTYIENGLISQNLKGYSVCMR